MPKPALRRIAFCRPAACVTFSFEGEPVIAYAGESVAAALAAGGLIATGRTRRLQTPRGYFCGMGACWECVVDIAGLGQRRGCMTPVAEGLEIRSVIAGDPA